MEPVLQWHCVVVSASSNPKCVVAAHLLHGRLQHFQAEDQQVRRRDQWQLALCIPKLVFSTASACCKACWH